MNGMSEIGGVEETLTSTHSIPRNSYTSFLTTDLLKVWINVNRQAALFVIAWASIALATMKKLRGGPHVGIPRKVPVNFPRRWLGSTRAFCVHTSKPMGWSTRWSLHGQFSLTANFGCMALAGTHTRDAVEVVYEHAVDDGVGGSRQYFVSYLPWFSTLMIPTESVDASRPKKRPIPAIYASFDTAPEIDVSALLNERIWSFYGSGIPYAALKAVMLSKEDAWNNPTLHITLGDLTELTLADALDRVAW